MNTTSLKPKPAEPPKIIEQRQLESVNQPVAPQYNFRDRAQARKRQDPAYDYDNTRGESTASATDSTKKPTYYWPDDPRGLGLKPADEMRAEDSIRVGPFFWHKDHDLDSLTWEQHRERRRKNYYRAPPTPCHYVKPNFRRKDNDGSGPMSLLRKPIGVLTTIISVLCLTALLPVAHAGIMFCSQNAIPSYYRF